MRDVRSENELGWSDASEPMFKSSSIDPCTHKEDLQIRLFLIARHMYLKVTFINGYSF